MSNPDYFPNIVGLNETKRRLTFYINNFHATGIMPHLLLSSAKGKGKTSVGRLIANSGMRRRIVEINCASFEKLDDFFAMIKAHIRGRKSVLFMDEAENLSKELSGALLTILNPNKENLTKYTHNNEDFIFDFKDINFILATTELQAIHHALQDRLRIVDFDEYDSKDLEQLMANNFKGYKVENGILKKIVSVVRGNPRQAEILSTDLMAFLNFKKTNILSSKEWADFYREMGLHELGLTNSEIKLLKVLRENPNSSLTKVASIMNQTVASTRTASELYPLKLGLFNIYQAKGRVLSQTGQEYLKRLDENKQ